MKKMFIVALIVAFAAACGGKKSPPKGPDTPPAGSADPAGSAAGSDMGSAPAPEGGGSGG